MSARPGDGMVVAVTGAGGFVGRALIRAGASAGLTMRAITRGSELPDGARELRRIRSLGDDAGLEAALAGADAVIHCAARVHVMKDEGSGALELFREVNVEGSRHLITSARRAGVSRFVAVSSAKVLGEGASGRVLRDANELAPEGAYATSKAEMETLLSANGSQFGHWAIIRPPLVYGPGVGGNFRRLLRLADLGGAWPIPLGGVHNRRSLVAVRNLASATLRVLSDPRANGRRYLVSDGTDVSTAALLERLGALIGHRVRSVRVPPALLQLGLQAIGRRAEADRLLGSFQVDSSAITRELDWTPPLTLDAGLAEVVAWWRSARTVR